MDPQHIRNRKQKTTIAEMDSDTVPQQFPGAGTTWGSNRAMDDPRFQPEKCLMSTLD